MEFEVETPFKQSGSTSSISLICQKNKSCFITYNGSVKLAGIKELARVLKVKIKLSQVGVICLNNHRITVCAKKHFS